MNSHQKIEAALVCQDLQQLVSDPQSDLQQQSDPGSVISWNLSLWIQIRLFKV